MARWNVETILFRGMILPIALMFIIPPLFKLWNYTQHRLGSSATLAEVVHTDDGVFTLPVLVFTDDQGTEHQFKSEIPYYFLWAPKQGDHLTVHFLSTDPKTVRTESFIHYIFYPLTFLAAGLILLRSVFSVSRKQKSSP